MKNMDNTATGSWTPDNNPPSSTAKNSCHPNLKVLYSLTRKTLIETCNSFFFNFQCASMHMFFTCIKLGNIFIYTCSSRLAGHCLTMQRSSVESCREGKKHINTVQLHSPAGTELPTSHKNMHEVFQPARTEGPHVFHFQSHLTGLEETHKYLSYNWDHMCKKERH